MIMTAATYIIWIIGGKFSSPLRSFKLIYMDILFDDPIRIKDLYKPFSNWSNAFPIQPIF